MARDQYRHPAQTLRFLGLKPEMTVVEIWPSEGWYTEILAPATRPRGIYYAAGWRKEVHTGFTEKLETRPDVYDHVVVTELSVPERTTIAPPGTADMVLTFRNVHNWMQGDYAQEMFRVFYRTLRPDGILGLVEHRARPGASIKAMKASGYVTERHVIGLAEQAGFVLEAKSEINANPKDTTDHPAGVWTLPPTLQLCEEMDAGPDRKRCLKKYGAIGESDRMTLRFRKPVSTPAWSAVR
ncbi:MAG: class I SAM-dependent methyltransferase [Gammaproteobacteria bacterium]|nr:class I SAM-dependent methyltransferase [Gammaproteobacteria bacterium]